MGEFLHRSSDELEEDAIEQARSNRAQAEAGIFYIQIEHCMGGDNIGGHYIWG